MSNWSNAGAGSGWEAHGSVAWSNRDLADGTNVTGTTTFDQQWRTVDSNIGWVPSEPFDVMRVVVENVSGPRGAEAFRITDTDGDQFETPNLEGADTHVPEGVWLLAPIGADDIDKVEMRLNNGDTSQEMRLVELQLGRI